MLVENRDVGGKSGLETAAIPDSEEVGRLRGDALDRLLQGHRSPFADPGAEQISAVAGVAEHVHMRAAVGETDHGARIGNQLANSGFMILLHRELDVQVVGECEVKKSIERIFVLLLGDCRDRPALVHFERRIGDLEDLGRGSIRPGTDAAA